MTLNGNLELLAAPEDAADDSSDLIDDGFDDAI
jgi:hypothetical protein